MTKRWADFSEKGYDSQSPFARKIWRISRILGVSPFSDEVLGLNQAQMDYILESYALDTPGAKFIRQSDEIAKENETTILKQWSDKLIGKAKEALVSKLRFNLPQQYQPVKAPARFSPPEKRPK